MCIHVQIYSESFCLAPSHLAYKYQRLASLLDFFGSLRKPTERAEAGPYIRTFAHKKSALVPKSTECYWDVKLILYKISAPVWSVLINGLSGEQQLTRHGYKPRSGL